ncbi:MAG TPA: hypothetical protein VF974_03475 [Patescibacteria group bacterium]
MKHICQRICVFIKKFVFWAFIIVIIGVPLYFLFKQKENDLIAWMTYYLAIITGGVIWWQGKQLKRQLELQTLTELYKEWNNEEMSDARKKYFTDEADLDATENVIEFLEKIASYYNKKVLTRDLIWDTIGWYIQRYHFYSKNKIIMIREKWNNDNTLYRDLENLGQDLINMEAQIRHTSVAEIENELTSQKEKFKISESK